MTGILTGVAFPNIEDISAFEFVYGRGIEPGVCIVECLPQEEMAAAPGELVITYGSDDFKFPDMLPVEQYLQQADTSTETEPDPKPGFRMLVVLHDHRHRWKSGAITGLYNLRLADGTVYTPTKKEPAELATLCLLAMGETGFDVSAMPTGVYPPILWDNANPAQCLDHLCRYVGCEITGGERAQVVIVPTGAGASLPDDGDYINPRYSFGGGNRPSTIQIQGGLLVWQAKLKLTGHVVQDAVAGLLSDNNWSTESPFSLPGIAAAELRHDGFSTEFRQFPVTSLADGSNNLPLAPFPITKPHQYILRDYRLDTFLDLQQVPQNYPARAEGKFFPYGDDADSYTTIQPYTGRFLIRREGNIVEFPYPIWKTSETGAVEPPELYLLTSFWLQKLDGDGRATFVASAGTGGTLGVHTLQRPELFYSIKVSYQADGITTAGQTTTEAPAAAEAQKYLEIFTAALTTINQLDVEWLQIRDIKLSGRIAQCRLKGSVRPNDGGFTTRASEGFEFDLHGPAIDERRCRRFVRSKMQGACP